MATGCPLRAGVMLAVALLAGCGALTASPEPSVPITRTPVAAAPEPASARQTPSAPSPPRAREFGAPTAPGGASGRTPAAQMTATPTSAPSVADTLWAMLSGFAGKTNRERQRYVAETLFPRAGLKPSFQPVRYSGPWRAAHGDWDDLSNVYSLVAGALPAEERRLLIVGAHFDKATYPGWSVTPGFSDGILDNATGVTALVNAATALRRPRHDVVFVAFASEEPDPYFLGSRAFFEALPDRQRVALFVNVHILGRGNLALIRGSADERAAELTLASAQELGVQVVWRGTSYETNSDFLVAQRLGIPVLAITSSDYEARHLHVPEDRLSAVDRAAFTSHSRVIARLIERVDLALTPLGRS